MRTIYHESGRNWINQLPTLLSELCEQFKLRELTPCQDLTYHYVACGYQNTTPIALKIGFDLHSVKREYQALKAFEGKGIIRLLDADLDKGALILEQAIPGVSLNTFFPDKDLTALKIACSLTSELHTVNIAPKNAHESLLDWLKILDQNWDFPIEHLQLARSLKKSLLERSRSQVLLHGDVHYGNFLSSRDQWVVIDPKGIIGDPLFDLTGCLLREPIVPIVEHSESKQLLENRFKFVAEQTRSDFQTIWNWTWVHSIMSICWSLEDSQDLHVKRRFLDLLMGIRFEF